MTHHIVVLGAGYAGAVAAGSLDRRLRKTDAHITLVNDSPDFVERVRLHELAVGHSHCSQPLMRMFAHAAVDIRIARATGIDVVARSVTLSDGAVLRYDSLVLGLGSSSATPAAEITGTSVHSVGDRAGAMHLRSSLSALATGQRVSVVGGGLTGLELASEIAESRPDVEVTLHTGNRLGVGLSDRGTRHLHTALARLRVQVRESARINAVDAETVRTDNGNVWPADLVAWTSGFTPSPILSRSELETHPDGRVIVDRSLRSVSHPEVLVVGDSARAPGPGGEPLRMSCASAIPMGWQASETLVAGILGRSARRVPFGYVTQCVSLGRSDGLIQPVHANDAPRRFALTGKAAAVVKEQVCRGAAWAVNHPTLGIPGPARSLR